MTWYEIPKYNQKIINKVVMTELQRKDSLLIDLTGITDKEDSYLQIELDAYETRTRDLNARLQYEIFFDRDEVVIERSVYNTFMLLGDIGGLSSILFTIDSIFNQIWHTNNAENFLAKQLYVKREKKTGGNY